MTAPPDQPPTNQAPTGRPPTEPAARPTPGEHRSHPTRTAPPGARPSAPPSPLGLPDRVHFWLRWLGFCSLLVVLFAFAAHAVEPASGPSWLFLGLQLAAFIGVVAIGVPLLLDGAARIRANRRNRGPHPDHHDSPSSQQGDDGRR